MKKTTKVILAAILIMAVAIGFRLYFPRHFAKPEIETTKVKIANLPLVQGLPLYLAIEKGYFREAGLDVEMIKFESPNQIVDALLSSQVDFTSPSGAMGILGIANFKNPGKIQIYAVAGGDNYIQNDAILVKTSSTLKNIQELKGKKLGILPGIQWRTIAQHILSENNLTVDKDVTLVELAVGLQAPALSSGEIDALLGVEPTPTIIKDKGIGRELVSMAAAKYIANPFYGGAGAVRTEFSIQNPKTTAKILSILERSINEINENPELARQYLQKNTPLTATAIAQVPISRFKMYSELNTNDISSIQKFYDIFSTYHIIDGHINFQSIIYSPIVK